MEVGGRQLVAGDVFAGYLIESLAGRGGMGLVYRARQRRPDRMVAVKVIAPDLAGDEDFRARFEQEASLAAQIEHPNVIPIYEVGDEAGVLYIVMRFVESMDLGVLLRTRGRLEPTHAARMVSQIGAALDAAHERGLVHRDVKPANVLVTGTTDSEHIYLTDFGLTKRITDFGRSGMTATGGFVGTLDYIAPEQVSGAPVDGRGDVYALGCVLYQLLTGVVPFPRDSEVAKIFAHLTEAPPMPSGTVPSVSPEMDEVVAHAMAKAPADRYQSAGELGHAATVAAAAGVNDGPPLPQEPAEARTPAGRRVDALSVDLPAVREPHASTPPDDRPGSDGGGGAAEPAPVFDRIRRRRWLVVIAVAIAAALAAVFLVLGRGASNQAHSPPSQSSGPSAVVAQRVETTGGPANTWTNYATAGGSAGPGIPANTSVRVACAISGYVGGFKVANGNTWWYRIASSPWDGYYYASADAFYNNGRKSGDLRGTPLVDPKVPDC